jgi:hypothetical protein
MFMVVVIVVMTVPVVVHHPIMSVHVTVSLAEQKHQRAANERGRPRLDSGEGLAQEQQGEDHSEERSNGEYHLAPGGPQSLRCGDVEGNADTIRKRPHHQGQHC